ncbi:MAG TPA: choice-of-anchor D domain-containing protein [Terriglobales bacterium]|nr:choice-of-anchor D domain-containing protein [Terriglobales bacterium]
MPMPLGKLLFGQKRFSSPRSDRVIPSFIFTLGMLSWALSLTACGGVATSNSTTSTRDRSALTFSPSSLSFGSIKAGSSGQILPVTVQNTGSATLQISQMTIGGAHNGNFTETNNCGSGLSVGSSCTVSVKFNPSQTGQQSATFQVTDNASGSPQTVALSGSGAIGDNPAVTFKPSTLDFGSVQVGGAGSMLPVVMQNTGGATLQISQMTISGAQNGNFTETNNCGSSLSAGSNCTISVTFNPTQIGQQSATIRVGDNATGSPQSVSLNGRGQSTTAFDQFGGLTSVPCNNTTGGTGWNVVLIKSRWWFCDPMGDGFVFQGVSISTGRTGNTYVAAATAKYGDTSTTWGPKMVERFQGWGFNGVGPASDNSVSPLSQSVAQVPMLQENLAASQYPGVDLWNYGPNPTKNLVYGTNNNWNGFDNYHAYLADVFDPAYSTWWGGYAQNQMGGLASSPWVIGFAWDDVDFMWGLGAGPDFSSTPGGHNSTNVSFTVALTSPVQTADLGHNGLGSYRNIAVLYPDPKTYAKVAMSSLPATCNLTTPCSLRDYLAKKYGTISALNAAWGSNYTTFDSSGSAVTGEALGTGDGTTLTFSKTLAGGTQVSPYSVAIYVNNTIVAGDCPWFTVGQGCSGGGGNTGILGSPTNAWGGGSAFYQPLEIVDSLGNGEGLGYLQQLTGSPANTFCIAANSPPKWNTTAGGTTTDGSCTWTNRGPAVLTTSTIDYSTKAISITFAVAPASGAAITVDYVADGWMYGTGLMDEDGRNSWTGSPKNGVCLISSNSPYTPCTGAHPPTMQATMGADLDAWTQQFAGYYLKTVTTQIHNTYPNLLLFGPNTLGTWGAPSHIGWLQAASQYLDGVYIQSYTVPPAVSRAEGTAINNFFINNLSVPIIENNGNVQSGADSYLYGYVQTANIGLTNQESRGQFFYDDWNYKLNTPDQNGIYHFVGFNYFPALDFDSSTETQDWGFIDSLDNPYDGVHDCVGSSTETIGGTQYTDGGETSFSGNILPGWQANTAYKGPTNYSGGGGNEILVNVSGTPYMLQPNNGISGATEPDWTQCLGVGSKCSGDGTVTWTNMGTKTSSTCWGNYLGDVENANSLWLNLSQ